MMKNRKRTFSFYCALALFFAFPPFLFGNEDLYSLSESLPNITGEECKKLQDGEIIAHVNDEAVVSNYAIKGTKLHKIVSNDLPSQKNGFAVSSVSFVSYPESWKKLSFDERLLLLYNAMSRVSRQKGITYISRRAGYKPKVLFSESHYIETANKKSAPLQDPVSKKLPKNETRFVFQEDTSFGGNVYEQKWETGMDEIFVAVTNLTAMRYHGITALKEREQTISVSASLLSDGILISSSAVIRKHKKTMTVFVVKLDLADSFMRRVASVHEWLKAQIEKS